MRVAQEDAVAAAEYGGRTYYFCSQECRQEFEAHPQDDAED
ncbi:MAG: YHS domain-containing protein [Gemmatimonadetes bacterium]|nr:YHS domain-containing protein [Gemmatimonadota bacterium]